MVSMSSERVPVPRTPTPVSSAILERRNVGFETRASLYKATAAYRDPGKIEIHETAGEKLGNVVAAIRKGIGGLFRSAAIKLFGPQNHPAIATRAEYIENSNAIRTDNRFDPNSTEFGRPTEYRTDALQPNSETEDGQLRDWRIYHKKRVVKVANIKNIDPNAPLPPHVQTRFMPPAEQQSLQSFGQPALSA